MDSLQSIDVQIQQDYQLATGLSIGKYNLRARLVCHDRAEMHAMVAAGGSESSVRPLLSRSPHISLGMLLLAMALI